MVDILHMVGVKSSSPDRVFDALTTLQGLSGWWTKDTRGDSGNVGGVIQFRFEGGAFERIGNGKRFRGASGSGCSGRNTRNAN